VTSKREEALPPPVSFWVISVRKALPPLFLAISIFFVYLGTIAPGLTWANTGADGGDFVTASATWGVPHPTGYPVYLLLAKLFQLLPVGSLAFRTNLLSALAAVLTVVLVYGLLVWPAESPVQGNWQAGLLAAAAFGLSPLFWSQAVITEVYTLQSAFLAGALLLALQPPTRQLDRWRGLLLGLALGNHLTSLFFVPAVLVAAVWRGGWQFDWRSLLRSLAWLGAGLLVYLSLPLRALSNPPVNWGNPVTPRRFLWLVSGELYQRNLFDLTLAGVLDRARAVAGLLLDQFALPGLFLALVGLLFFFKPTRLYFLTLFVALVYSLFAILYASFDSYVYLLPVFLSFALWLGLGLGGLFPIESRGRTRWVVFLVGLALCLGLTFQRWPTVDASRDQRAEAFGAKMLADLPPRALVLASGDRAIFALWYFHFALGQRPDLAILVPDFFGTDWYLETLRSRYPALRWEGNAIRADDLQTDNPGRPLCRVAYLETLDLSCISP
jgi:hypothetical protein